MLLFLLFLAFKTQGATYCHLVALSFFSDIFISVLFLWLVFWRFFRWLGWCGVRFFCIATIRMADQDKLHFPPIIFLLRYPLHQHFPQAKLMLHHFFKHNKQSQGCHLIAESIQLAEEDITLCFLCCTHHPLESICSFLLFNKGSFGLWIKCHLQYPLEL